MTSINLDARHFVEFPQRNRLTYGLNYRHIRVASNFLPDPVHQNRLGLFLQNEWNPTPELIFVAGLRFDLHSDINPNWNPRGSVIYKPWQDHTFRASISMAQRPPTPFETNQEGIVTINLPPPFSAPPPLVFQGSPDLDPEQIISYEIGYQGCFLRHRLQFRAELFFNHISNRIEEDFSTPGIVTFAN